MRSGVPLLVIFVAIAGLCGCGRGSGDEADRARKEIAAAEQAFAARVAVVGEGTGFAEFLDPEEGKLFRNAPVPVKGEAAIRAFYGARRDGTKLSWSPSEIIAAKSGEMGVSWGRWLYEIPGDGQNTPPRTQAGSYVTVWRKNTKGEWKGLIDIGQPDAPPPAQLVTPPPAPGLFRP